MDDQGPLCLTCADMDHLVFLPAGGAGNGTPSDGRTRTWNCRPVSSRRSPGCSPAAPASALRRSPGTPPLRGSGRVGRSAAGRSLDEKAVTLAVVASVRHEDTEYDALLMSGVPRDEARDRIRPDIDRVLDAWAKETR
jgi:hypothetical protein